MNRRFMAPQFSGHAGPVRGSRMARPLSAGLDLAHTACQPKAQTRLKGAT